MQCHFESAHNELDYACVVINNHNYIFRAFAHIGKSCVIHIVHTCQIFH